MKGLVLAESFYTECFEPLVMAQHPELMDIIAAGLVGEGSECLGFDDKTSQDHDFGAGFCVWLPERLLPQWRDKILGLFLALPAEYKGYKNKFLDASQSERVGVFSIEEFYGRFLGIVAKPTKLSEWRRMSPEFLASTTNGKVFHDKLGDFSSIRQELLAFYPDDIFKKKLARNLALMAQTGQYNALRMQERKDNGAVALSILHYVDNALSAYFLLEKKYKPFYKWSFHALKELSTDARKFAEQLESFINSYMETKIISETALDAIAEKIVEKLQKEKISQIQDKWLMTQAEHIQKSIEHAQLRAMPILGE